MFLLLILPKPQLLKNREDKQELDWDEINRQLDEQVVEEISGPMEQVLAEFIKHWEIPCVPALLSLISLRRGKFER